MMDALSQRRRSKTGVDKAVERQYLTGLTRLTNGRLEDQNPHGDSNTAALPLTSKVPQIMINESIHSCNILTEFLGVISVETSLRKTS